VEKRLIKKYIVILYNKMPTPAELKKAKNSDNYYKNKISFTSKLSKAKELDNETCEKREKESKEKIAKLNRQTSIKSLLPHNKKVYGGKTIKLKKKKRKNGTRKRK